MKTPPASTSGFIDWVSGASIYVGYARYGQLGWDGFVAVAVYDSDDQLRDAVEDLDAGDNEAIAAAEFIEQHSRCWHASDRDPVVAVAKLMDKMREYHRALSIEMENNCRRSRT